MSIPPDLILEAWDLMNDDDKSWPFVAQLVVDYVQIAHGLEIDHADIAHALAPRASR